ncbi:UvrD-like Helicase, ATP-binding domain, P-loop containing nucleoside triphosphate hydrolase, partial [Quillaja saponaria]
DVLLYNFFGSSPFKNKWRVIYEYMKEHDLLNSTPAKSYPRFNESKHSVLCSELKQLYVAVTRTRQRLWICEILRIFLDQCLTTGKGSFLFKPDNWMIHLLRQCKLQALQRSGSHGA